MEEKRNLKEEKHRKIIETLADEIKRANEEKDVKIALDCVKEFYKQSGGKDLYVRKRVGRGDVRIFESVNPIGIVGHDSYIRMDVDKKEGINLVLSQIGVKYTVKFDINGEDVKGSLFRQLSRRRPNGYRGLYEETVKVFE